MSKDRRSLVLEKEHNFSIAFVIQMGTIAPTESQSIRDRVVDAGGEYLEAPVLGVFPR